MDTHIHTYRVEHGGEVDAADKYIAPTILRAEKTSDCMKDEIFGPIMPVIVVDTLEDAVDYVNSGGKPLALYVFSEDQQELDTVLQTTTSGGACLNDAVMHAGNPELPFGGVGDSGTPSLPPRYFAV